MNPKKEKLIALSAQARELREELNEDTTINKILIKHFYTDLNNSEFNTYKQWKELGYQVKRGEKAFLIWGKKRTNKKQETKEKDKDDEYKFYPMAFLFSNAQVEPLEAVA